MRVLMVLIGKTLGSLASTVWGANVQSMTTVPIPAGNSRFSKYLLGLANTNPVAVLTEKGATPMGSYARRINVIVD